MGRGLSRGLDPVMTGGTGTRRNSEMPEGHAGPGNGPVAIVTGHGRRDVRGGFPLRGAIVVTLRTGARRHPVMGKEGRRPICRPVAAVAVD